jgi:hypothetical protein
VIRLGLALDATSLEPAPGPDGRPTPARLDPDELSRHAVCVGMTGSGKTGLCVGLLESLSEAGVPILAIDPKGDLSNLALLLDPSEPQTFEPWVDPGEAQRRGVSTAELAREAAAAWAAALVADGRSPARIARRRELVDVIIHTPGSEAGVPVDVLSALTRPPPGITEDPEGLREYVIGAVTALFGLLGRTVDPLTDPGAILVSRILSDAFAEGRALPLDVLVPRIVDPPFETLGFFSVEDTFPRAEREALAVAINNVVASPAFQGWTRGVPLDVAGWMAPRPDGRTPLRVLSLAHLDDRQRQFFATLLLHAVVAWTRRLPGTSRLRGLVYFDEVTGYLPPHPKNPPTKPPVLTLLKQARAVGVGVMLCTQNPVDVDYKALANAGTWFVGRLQTRQDRDRVVEGLLGGGELAAGTEELLAKLPRRAFLWRTADDPRPRLLRSRQVLSWLRGPLTRKEIASLGQVWRGGEVAPTDGLLGEPPPLPEDVPVRWLKAEGCAALGFTDAGVWRPTTYARIRIRTADGDELHHRWLTAPDTEPAATELPDAWLTKRAPATPARYHPVGDVHVSAQTRRTWLAEVVATERVALPNGMWVRPEARDVTVLAWAVVWVPC